MRISSIQRISGALIAGSSLMMLPPVLVSWLYADHTAVLFLESAAILFAVGFLIYLPARHKHQELRLRDGFLIVGASWLTLALAGALPFLLLDSPQLGFIDALFESMSGLTTTGATILVSIDDLPKGILYYRQQLQWLGGMGIIVLAVAVLPMLRIGGMQLFRAETPGPMKDNKLTPRITETAKALWLIYLSITVVCALAYWAAGMSLFDAVGHAYSTVAIGGFSTHDMSMGYFNNPAIEMIAMLFMVISGMNFALHYLAWRKASTSPYYQDTELKVYIIMLVVFCLLACATLFLNDTYDSLSESFRYGSFQIVSALTTTGFTTASFHVWPSFVPVMLILIAFIGGCAGSTAGGMKVMRVILLFRQAVREIKRLIHPHAVIPVKLGGKRMSSSVMDAVWGFFFLFVASFCVLAVLLVATGLDLITAFSATAACLTNLGPALGQAGPHYNDLNQIAKALLSFAMLIGRLEVFTLLVLLTPAFWRD